MIRKLAAILCALALLTSQAFGDWMINSYRFGGITPAVTFIGCTASSSALTTYTFTSHSIGAGPRTHVIVAVGAGDGLSAFSTNTVTVAGNSATEIADQGGSGIQNASLHIVADPGGTTATIVVTMSEAVLEAGVCVWSAILNSATPVSSIAAWDTASAPIALTLSSTAAGGVAVGYCNAGSSTLSATWANLTERLDNSTGWAFTSHTAADGSTAGGSLAVTCDYTGTADAVGVAAAFQ